MSFWDFVGGAIDAFSDCVGGAIDAISDFGRSCIESIGSGIKSVGEFVSGCIDSIGSLGSQVLSVIKPIALVVAVVAPQIGLTFLSALEKVITVVNVIAKVLNLLNEGEDLDDLGERALEAAELGKTREQYENADEYLEMVKNTPKSDNPNKYSLFAKRMAGLSVIAEQLQSKFDFSPELYGTFVEYEKFFTPQRIKSYTQSAQSLKIDLNEIIDFFNSNSTMHEKAEAKKVLIELEKHTDANFDLERFNNDLLDAKLKVN